MLWKVYFVLVIFNILFSYTPISKQADLILFCDELSTGDDIVPNHYLSVGKTSNGAVLIGKILRCLCGWDCVHTCAMSAQPTYAPCHHIDHMCHACSRTCAQRQFIKHYLLL